jgi:hypothetical protein
MGGRGRRERERGRETQQLRYAETCCDKHTSIPCVSLHLPLTFLFGFPFCMYPTAGNVKTWCAPIPILRPSPSSPSPTQSPCDPCAWSPPCCAPRVSGPLTSSIDSLNTCMSCIPSPLLAPTPSAGSLVCKGGQARAQAQSTRVKRTHIHTQLHTLTHTHTHIHTHTHTHIHTLPTTYPKAANGTSKSTIHKAHARTRKHAHAACCALHAGAERSQAQQHPWALPSAPPKPMKVSGPDASSCNKRDATRHLSRPTPPLPPPAGGASGSTNAHCNSCNGAAPAASISATCASMSSAAHDDGPGPSSLAMIPVGKSDDSGMSTRTFRV